MNKKRIVTFVMVLLLVFASLSLIMVSVGPLGGQASSNYMTSTTAIHGIPIAGHVDPAPNPIGG